MSSDFAPEHNPRLADSTPDYDGLGWDSQWSAQDWMTWHAAMVVRYGKGQADSRFLSAWNSTGSFFDEPPLSARSFDSVFRDWARSNGLLDGLYGYGLGVLAKPLGAANDVLDGVTAVAGGVKETGQTIGGGALKWILGAVVLIALAFYFAPQLARAWATKKKA